MHRNIHRRGYFGLLALLVVIAIIAILMFGTFGKDGGSYVGTVVDSREKAQVRVSQVDLANLHRELQMMAVTADGFPTEAELLANSGIARSLKDKAAAAGGAFFYIEGQTQRLPASNLLVYITGPDDETPVTVLRLGGAVE